MAGNVAKRPPWEVESAIPRRGRHPEMLTMSEVADLLRIPIATLRYWRHKGDVPAAPAWSAASATSAPMCSLGSPP